MSYRGNSGVSMDERIQEVKFNIERAKAFTEGWHTNIKHWRDLYYSKHYSGAPLPGESRYNDPTYTNTVDLAVGIMLANPIIWGATSWKITGDSTELESQVEKFLSGVGEVNTDRNEYDTNYEVLLHYVRDGGCILYTIWDNNIAQSYKSFQTLVSPEGEELPIIVYEECPIRQQVIDPMTVYLLPGGKNRWLAVARAEKISLLDLKVRFNFVPSKYKHLEGDNRMMSTTFGTLYDYWDVSASTSSEDVIRNATLFEDEFIPDKDLIEIPGMKQLPYTIGLYNPTSRTDSSKWQSILSPLIEPVKHLETSINRRQRQINVFASLPIVAKVQPGRTAEIDPGLAKLVTMSPDEDLGFPVWQGNPPDVERQIEFLRSRVQQSGFSDVFIGSGASAVSGYSLSQLGDQNRIRLEQPIAHLKRFWQWSANKIINITLNNAEDNTFMYLYGKLRGKPFISLVPLNELEGFHITCDIKPNFPNDQVRKHAMGNQVRGILSEETIMERYLDVQQPDEEYDRKLNELVQTNPITVEFSLMKELSKRAATGDDIAAAVLQRLQQQGMQGQPGAPTQPQNFEQGLGVPQPNRNLRGMGNPDDMGMAAPDMTGGV